MTADAIGTARPVLSPGTDALAQANEALRVAEALLNAYAGGIQSCKQTSCASFVCR
jgi:hypothetical protein